MKRQTTGAEPNTFSCPCRSFVFARVARAHMLLQHHHRHTHVLAAAAIHTHTDTSATQLARCHCKLQVALRRAISISVLVINRITFNGPACGITHTHMFTVLDAKTRVRGLSGLGAPREIVLHIYCVRPRPWRSYQQPPPGLLQYTPHSVSIHMLFECGRYHTHTHTARLYHVEGRVCCAGGARPAGQNRAPDTNVTVSSCVWTLHFRYRPVCVQCTRHPLATIQRRWCCWLFSHATQHTQANTSANISLHIIILIVHMCSSRRHSNSK